MPARFARQLLKPEEGERNLNEESPPKICKTLMTAGKKLHNTEKDTTAKSEAKTAKSEAKITNSATTGKQKTLRVLCKASDVRVIGKSESIGDRASAAAGTATQKAVPSHGSATKEHNHCEEHQQCCTHEKDEDGNLTEEDDDCCEATETCGSGENDTCCSSKANTKGGHPILNCHFCGLPKRVLLSSSNGKKNKFGHFCCCCIADSQTDAGRHHLYTNDSLVLFSIAWWSCIQQLIFGASSVMSTK